VDARTVTGGDGIRIENRSQIVYNREWGVDDSVSDVSSLRRRSWRCSHLVRLPQPAVTLLTPRNARTASPRSARC